MLQGIMIVIEQENPIRFFLKSDSIPRWIGVPGIEGEIGGCVNAENGWKTTSLPEHIEMRVLENTPKEGHRTIYLYMPYKTAYVGIVQNITKSVIAFTPITVPEKTELDCYRTYYMMG